MSMKKEEKKTLKEGERMVGPSTRPDGTLRKPIRIRAGYVPQDEVAIYQSKGALWRKEMCSAVLPPGYDPDPTSKPKSKSSKKKKKEKESLKEDSSFAKPEVESVTSQINHLLIDDSSNPNPPDIHKKIRALKKKIRLAEAQIQLKPEQLDKFNKIKGWQEELKLLEQNNHDLEPL